MYLSKDLQYCVRGMHPLFQKEMDKFVYVNVVVDKKRNVEAVCPAQLFNKILYCTYLYIDNGNAIWKCQGL